MSHLTRVRRAKIPVSPKASLIHTSTAMANLWFYKLKPPLLSARAVLLRPRPSTTECTNHCAYPSSSALPHNLDCGHGIDIQSTQYLPAAFGFVTNSGKITDRCLLIKRLRQACLCIAAHSCSQDLGVPHTLFDNTTS